jgi:hypothetical protein
MVRDRMDKGREVLGREVWGETMVFEGTKLMDGKVGVGVGVIVLFRWVIMALDTIQFILLYWLDFWDKRLDLGSRLLRVTSLN